MTRVEFINNYESNKHGLMNFARKLTRNSSEADDILQETMIKAFKNKDSFIPGSSFKSWAFTILKNCFISGYRKKKRRGVIGADISQYTFGLQGKSPNTNLGVSNLNVQEIHNCMEALSPKMQDPIKLYIEGFQYNEIAEKLDIPIGTVKSRINFTRKKLQQTLIDRGLAA